MYFSKEILKDVAVRRPITIYIGDDYYDQSSVSNLPYMLKRALSTLPFDYKGNITINFYGANYLINAKVLTLILISLENDGIATIQHAGEALTVEDTGDDIFCMFANLHTESFFLRDGIIHAVLGERK
ncbi:hypothetical protein P13BB106kb_p010 [Pectobacterium phage DU_PP_V]|uniref:Uncharacterized protein n=1 Tax=Pectobacterium phage DU_PP_V TaxID=2041492 RepID=A0A2D2W708_9CAUD|nr:hypothetical protein HOS40_gp010 [Pectobacterium phage DU_PP_V]ATS93994.1 hypothetical protein P13BB106kb_p010 [Pectobacterium phage DU_PP_V]